MLLSDSRLQIFRGQDKSFILKLKNSKTGDPYSLADATLIQVVFTLDDKSKLVLSNAVLPAVKAQAKKGTVIFTANIAGASGNAISLSFNGVDSYDEVVTAWNDANPTNTVMHNAVDGTMPVSSGTIQLSGGYNSYQPVEIWGNPEHGKVKILVVEKNTAKLRFGSNNSFAIIVDKGDNPAGIRNIGTFENKVDVKDIF